MFSAFCAQWQRTRLPSREFFIYSLRPTNVLTPYVLRRIWAVSINGHKMRSSAIVGEYAAYFIAVTTPDGKLRTLRNSLLVIGASRNSYFFPSKRVRTINPSQL